MEVIILRSLLCVAPKWPLVLREKGKEMQVESIMGGP